jgi:uncharacterized protein YecT (DUF1311 family)
MRRFILVTLFAVYASAQIPVNNRPKKVLTPEQLVYQQTEKDYNAKLDKLRVDASVAYSAELVREKAPECPDANNTYDMNMCLGHEMELTDANYKAFTTALRAMLSAPEPVMPGEHTPYDGPTGQAATPATNTAAFDAAESAWQSYAKAECSAVDTLWRSGTIVNAMVGECSLRMARSRLHELDNAYEMKLRPH